MKNIYRHGDIPIHPIKEVEGKKVRHDGSFVLAEGETTGHKHVISVQSVDDMEVRRASDGGYFLTLRTEATVSHQEHKTIRLAPGTYRVGKEREKDWFSLSVRRVID